MFNGQKLREARNGKGWTQEQVASKLSFHLKRRIRTRQVIRHEQTTQPTAEFIGAYASIFGLPAEHFLGEDPDEEAAQVSLEEALAMEIRKAIARELERVTA